MLAVSATGRRMKRPGMAHAERGKMAHALERRPTLDLAGGGFGEPLPRFEDDRMLRGGGRYVADLPLADCLSMAFVRSPAARAEIEALHLDAARAAAGVVAIYTGRDFAGLPQPRINARLGDIDAPDRPVLARGELRAVGQPVVAIVADSAAAAREAADLVVMELGPQKAICDPEAAIDAAAIFPETAGNTVLDHRWRSGDPSAWDAATTTAEIEIRHPGVAPAPLECRATAAAWDRDGEHLTIWTGTQTPQRARDDIARILGLDPARVRAVAPDVGGAFGMKASIYPEDVAVAMAARDLGRPVRWVAERSEDLLAASLGRGALARGSAAFDATGRILALRADMVFPLGAWLTFSAAVPPWNAARILPGPYAIETVEVRVRGAVTNTAPVGIYRGAGRPEAAMLLERLIEAGARKLGVDPAAVRRRNLVAPATLPLARANGTTLDSGDYPALLEKTLLLAGYDRLRARRRQRRDRNELVGIGSSLYVEPCGQGWESASVTLETGGRFTVATGSSAQGQGRETTFAQIAARELAVAPEAIDIVQGDTRVIPKGTGALASRSTAIGGSAVLQATRALVDKARPLGARLLEAGGSPLVADGAGFRTAGRSGRSITWDRIAAAAGKLRAEAVYTADGEAWACGCCLAQVSVDRFTGRVTLERLVCVDDAGTVVNPRLVDGQIAGGLAQGIGEALLERVVHDPFGQPLTGSLMDYALPRADDMPAIELDRMCTPSPFNTLGAKGVGEAGTIGAPPAIVNAVLDALAPLGVEHVDLPLTPERVWRAIRAAAAGRREEGRP